MVNDGTIRVLPLHVANKIAAGEVVERPASVVKELVENAIDAGATNIRITIEKGGAKLVSVQDDGSGMTRENALLSLERQATSKIRDVDDIEHIATLGFRGEAIPSIASVSRFSITTRRHDTDEGTFIQVDAGTLSDVRAAGCPPGTRIDVRDLFCNVPARRKFLRAQATEERHVKHVFTVHALAHPEIAFTLIVDGRETYRLARANDLTSRVRDLFGEAFMEAVSPLPTPVANAIVRVTGYVEKPNLSTPTRREPFVFVNRRPASAAAVAYALREAYPRREADVRPSVLLFLDMDPSLVDVNVHPTKREVRFRNNAAVKDALVTAIRATFCPVPTIERRDDAATAAPLATTDRDDTRAREDVPRDRAFESPSLARTFEPLPSPSPVQTEISFSSDGVRAKPWKSFKTLAMTASGYLIVETDSGLVTINPVAACERIAYEKLMDGAVETLSQPLLIPDVAQLPPADFARLVGALDVLQKMGFQLEAFGTDTFKVDAVPALIGEMKAATILATIAHDLGEGGARAQGTRWREELVAKSVAREVAGTKRTLTDEGAKRLVESLATTRMPYVTPRGKPVMIFTSTRELDRRFDRT